MKALKWCIICAVSGFFLYAGITKVLDPVEFGRSILRYQLVGQNLAWIAALWLPWLEILSALGLLWARWRPAATRVLLGLLVFFEGILLTALLRGLDINCGCLGTNASGSVSFAMVRNVGLILLLVLLIFSERSNRE